MPLFEMQSYKDRKALQKQAKEAELYKRGINPETNEYFEGSKEQLLADQVNILSTELQNMKKKQVNSEEFDALYDGVKKGDYTSWNQLIHNNPIMNKIYKTPKEQGGFGIHKLHAPTMDMIREDSEYIKELNKVPGMDSATEYLLAMKNNIDPETGYAIEPTVMVDGLEVEAEDGETLREIVKQLGVAYPLAEKQDGSFQLQSLEEHLATTGLLKSKFMSEQSDVMLDAVAKSERAIEGITTKLGNANDKLATAQAEEAKGKAEIQTTEAEQFLEWSKKNPGKSYGEFQTQGGGAKTKTEELRQDKLKLEIQKLAEKNQAEIKTAFENKEASKTSVQSTLNLLDDLIKHPGREAATGMSFPMAYIPGTDAFDFSSAIETVKSNIFLDSIQQMKGFGALSNAEGQKLDTAIRSLDLGQKEDTMKNNLQTIRDIFQISMDRLNSGKLDVSGNQETTSTMIKIGDVRNGYKYLGGDTSKKENWEKVN